MMFDKMAMFVERRTAISSLVVVICFFVIANVLLTPLLNSDDDTFFLYTLAGGYGEAPTQLLHYNNGWHPWLGWIVKSLFEINSSVNWFTLFLLLFHVAGCTAILYVLLKRLRLATAFFFFIVFFCFAEVRLLLYFTYTGAAFILSLGACMLLLCRLQTGMYKIQQLVLPVMLLIIAGMMRLQIAALLLALFIPVVFTLLRREQIVRWFVACVVTGLILFGLSKQQQYYYQKNIPGWSQQEKFRQALFYAYNRQVSPDVNVFADSTEQSLFAAGFLYDSSRFTAERVSSITKAITRKRSLGRADDRSGLYWFFMEMRVYLLLFLITLAAMLLNRQRRMVRNWLFSLLAVLLVHAYLFTFLKITMVIHLGLIGLLWLHLALQADRSTLLFGRNRPANIVLALLFLLSFGWMGLRVATEENQNRNRRVGFKCALRELNQSPQSLFVATDASFPADDFYIWDRPKDYPIYNLLYKERLLTHTWLNTLRRFHIGNLHEAIRNNKQVFLLGAPLYALATGDTNVLIAAPIPTFKCLEVRQLIAR